MNRYNDTQIVELDFDLEDADGDEVDPSTLVLIIRKPGGELESPVSTPAIVQVEPGLYRYLYDTTGKPVGVYTYRWQSGGTGQTAAEGRFFVKTSLLNSTHP